MHGGGPEVVAGAPLSPEYKEAAPELVQKGTANLLHHIRNSRKYD
jgi:formyltetrahydrofolate synthetase